MKKTKCLSLYFQLTFLDNGKPAIINKEIYNDLNTEVTNQQVKAFREELLKLADWLNTPTLHFKALPAEASPTVEILSASLT